MMSLRVIASVLPTELPQEPAEVAPVARMLAGRKVYRLLDNISYGAFVAAVRVLESLPEGISRQRLGLFTISAWDPSPPPPPFPLPAAQEDLDWRRLETHYARTDSPAEWLRAMPNCLLSQLAIAAHISGPNAHFSGTGSVLPLALCAMRGHFMEGSCDAALLVAFDRLGPTGEFRSVEEAQSVRSEAAAAILVPTEDDWSGSLTAFSQLEGTCVSVLERLILDDTAGRPRSPEGGARR